MFYFDFTSHKTIQFVYLVISLAMPQARNRDNVLLICTVRVSSSSKQLRRLLWLCALFTMSRKEKARWRQMYFETERPCKWGWGMSISNSAVFRTGKCQKMYHPYAAFGPDNRGAWAVLFAMSQIIGKHYL